MPTTSSPLSSDVLVNSMIKLEQQPSPSPNDSILNPLLPSLQLGGGGGAAHQQQQQQPGAPLQLLSQQQPILLPSTSVDGGLVGGAGGGGGDPAADDDCKVKIELDDLFPSVTAWGDDAGAAGIGGPASSASFLPASLTVSVANAPALLTASASSVSPPTISLNPVIAAAAAATTVKTVKVPTLGHSMSVPADMEAASLLKPLPQIPSSTVSALALGHLRPPPVSAATAMAAAAAAASNGGANGGLRISIPQSPHGAAQAADTTTSAGMATPSPGGASSIASPASASSTTKKTVFTAKGKKERKRLSCERMTAGR